jgi:hypothetical protein
MDHVKIVKRRALRALNTAPGADYPHPVVVLSVEGATEVRDALLLVGCEGLIDMDNLILNPHKTKEIREAIEEINEDEY